jgi:Autoinducer binding domain
MKDEPELSIEPTAAFSSFVDATQYLEQVCERMNVNHLAYALMDADGETQELLSWIATYDPAYMSYYMENHTQLGDPAFDIAFANNAVIDWTEMLERDPITQELLPMAARYGITKYGISIPLTDVNFGNVLFSVNVKSNDEDWPVIRDGLADRFRPVAHHFHLRVRPLIELRKLAEINFASQGKTCTVLGHS